MTLVIIFCLLMVTVSVLTYYFGKPQMRDVDYQDKTQRTAQVYHKGKELMMVNWIFTIVFIPIFFAVRPVPMALVLIGSIVLVLMLIFGWQSWRERGTYYRADHQGLAYVRNNNVEWSHRWDEIDHVYRRMISTGKTMYYLLDLYCKDGTVHKGLPYVLRKSIDQNKPVQNAPMNWRAFVIILGVVLITALVVLLLNVL